MADIDYERFKIKSYTHWYLYLHESQYFLGRMYIWSLRAGLHDLMDVTDEERAELFEIGREARGALTRLWFPDLFNWASLGNISQQCHVHVIPRYAKLRQFAGFVFKDTRWGQNYAPYDY